MMSQGLGKKTVTYSSPEKKVLSGSFSFNGISALKHCDQRKTLTLKRTDPSPIHHALSGIGNHVVSHCLYLLIFCRVFSACQGANRKHFGWEDVV
jgi:hypothetical protein